MPKSGRPAKQARRRPSPKHLELSEKNLRLFNGEEMDITGSGARAPSNKRSSSRRSSTAASDGTQDTTRSQYSSGTTAFYRYRHLAAAQVRIHTDPPDNIQQAIDTIVKAIPSDERRAELKAVAQTFHDGCRKAVKAALGEDDCVVVLLLALTAMGHRDLCLRAKVDWREELKPKIQHSGVNLNFRNLNVLAGGQQEAVDDTSVLPRKRQQQSAGQTYISPQTSMTNASEPTPANRPLESSTMPPPPAPREREADRSLIKTPRPDISLGTEHATLISALSSHNLNDIRAPLFLAELQEAMVRREPGGFEEPMLISVPAPRASDLVFPFAVVEGKAYSTGKQVFEAENQAAVSGACALKIQLCLDELAKNALASSDAPPMPTKDEPPLFFSICTQGPIHELWVHYTNVEHGIRHFNMTLLEICHGTLLKGVLDFIIAVDNVCRWGTGKFVESVVERLGKVAGME